MSVTRQIEIDWQGETHVITPTIGLLRQIELSGDMSLANVAARFLGGAPQVFAFAFILSRYLQSAGVKNASEEEVYAVLDRMPHEKLAKLATTVISTIVPLEGNLPGKTAAQGPAQGAGKKRRPKRKKRR